MSSSFPSTVKVRSIVVALLLVVALSYKIHLCQATVFHTDGGSATISNATFPAIDVTVQRSNIRVRDNRRRREQVSDEVSGIRNFKPLTCNSDIFKAGYVCSRTWSSLFGTSDTHTNRIIVPCGVCIVMNHASGKLNLNGGIDIQGKLIIPENVSINITTTTLIVQGELSMTSTTPITGIPKVKVTLVGSNEVTFTPIDVNAKACQGSVTCTAGKKSFVVAGGKVTCTYNVRVGSNNLGNRESLTSILLSAPFCCTIVGHSEWCAQFHTGLDALVRRSRWYIQSSRYHCCSLCDDQQMECRGSSSDNITHS
jgi:hypothetical protein